MVRGSRGRKAGRRQASSGAGGQNTTRSPAHPETHSQSASSETGTGVHRARSRSQVRTAPSQTATVPNVPDSSEHNRLGQLEQLVEKQAQTVNQLMEQVAVLITRPSVTPSTSASSSSNVYPCHPYSNHWSRFTNSQLPCVLCGTLHLKHIFPVPTTFRRRELIDAHDKISSTNDAPQWRVWSNAPPPAPFPSFQDKICI